MLEDLKVRELIGVRDRVFFVDAKDTGNVAALKLRNFKVRTTGVMSEGEIVGVVGHSDFSDKVVALGKKPTESRQGTPLFSNTQWIRMSLSSLPDSIFQNEQAVFQASQPAISEIWLHF